MKQKIILIILISLLVPIITSAIIINSTNYKTHITINSGGETINSTNYRSIISIGENVISDPIDALVYRTRLGWLAGLLPACLENWIANYTLCNVSDQRIKYYIDSNSCGTTTNLPIDNGTNESCNYCNENIIQLITPCVNNTQNISYEDLNLTTCCQITNITSDCSILFTPYNETTNQSCALDCSLDTEPILSNKMNVVCTLPDDQNYSCVINTYYGSNLLATSPEHEDINDSLFHSQERLLNAYYTKKNLRAENNFTLEVVCLSDGGANIKTEYNITPMYDSPDRVIHRMIWARENAPYLLMLGFIILIIIGVMIYYSNRAKRGL